MSTGWQLLLPSKMTVHHAKGKRLSRCNAWGCRGKGWWLCVSDHLWEIQTGPNEKATMLAILNAAQEMACREKATSTEQRAARSQGTEETSTASRRDNNSGVFEASAKCPPDGQLYKPVLSPGSLWTNSWQYSGMARIFPLLLLFRPHYPSTLE